jgi:hypothetical protein
MSKHVIIESYGLTPSTRTVTVTGKNIRKEQLLLITNVTNNASYQGTVIYNFSDPNLGSTSYTNSVDTTTGLETTTLVLSYNTASMLSTDKLAVMVEESYQEIMPDETLRDPVDKLRVSTPQALIDTDFEYGLQPTKWEQLNLINNRQTAFYDVTNPAVITNVVASGNTVTVTGTVASFTATIATTTMTVVAVSAGLLANGMVITGTGVTANSVITALGANTSGGLGTYTLSQSSTVAANTAMTASPATGTPLFVQGTLDVNNADGWWITQTSSGNTFTYQTLSNPSAALYDSQKTYVFSGAWFTGAAYPAAAGNISNVGNVLTITTTYNHGLRVGDGVFISNVTASANAPNGPFQIVATPTTNTFTVNTANLPGTSITAVANNSIFPRPLGYVQQRAFDGGVQFTNLQPYHGYQVVRQTRRYFRYQSGKGIQFSTGSILKPALAAINLTSSGTTVTVTCSQPHGLLPGVGIKVTGAAQTAYNGAGNAGDATYTVVTVPTPSTFTYTASATPSASPATSTSTGNTGIIVSPNSWYGGSNRLGMFDSQNGFYFEFDGQTLYAVRRNSTTQLSGLVTATNGSDSITGTNTKFSTQLVPGDFIVIRGTSYIVNGINSDTSMNISPEYRGATTASNATIVSKTINYRVAQSSWNIDKCDGTGASLFNLDLTKMQMFYADYSWYGAGAIRFGFKNNRGEVIYCHRMPNNNLNTEAFMRSGNLPSRYETNTLPLITQTTATLSNAAITGATISVVDTTGWPSSGNVRVVESKAIGGNVEVINYSAKTSTSLTIGTGGTNGRAITGGNTAAQTFTYSATAPTSVELLTPQAASVISHWGSSVIMDGRYDDDKSFVFSVGSLSPISNLAQNVRQPIMSIRLAPSVDNGLTGLIGVREILNRMQLTPRGIDAYTTGTAFRIDLILNGRLSGGTWATVGGSSLAQYIFHTVGQTLSAGEVIYSFFTNVGAATSQDLNLVRDIGTSILSGGTTNTASTTQANLYPDGPDVLTVVATNITSQGTNSINSRISWTEAQA